MTTISDASGSLVRRRSIRYPILAIAWIPSFVLLLVGVGIAATLAYQGQQVRSTTDDFDASAQPVALFTVSIFTERGLSERYVADPTSPTSMLTAVRAQVDTTLGTVQDVIHGMALKYPQTYDIFDQQIAAFRAGLGAERERITDRVATVGEVSQYFTAMTHDITTSMDLNAEAQQVSAAAVQQTIGVALVRATDEFQDADGLAQASFVGDGLTEPEYQLFTNRVGSYQARLQEILPLLPVQERSRLQGLFGSPSWRTITQLHADVIRNGPAERSGPQAPVQLPQPAVDLRTWTVDSLNAVQAITAVNIAQSTYANALSAAEASGQVRRSLLVGALLLLLAVGVFLLTTWVSNRLVHRLQRLREATLTMSQQHLPGIVERLRAGVPVDLEAELTPLEFGADEIGQVADAFEEAQRTAVAAAAREAETRAGLRVVFLDIARRSQAIVYRQLKVLDQAERSEEDPDQLALLFQLDHLSTRSRRNAENLIILGGEQPGRQWRNPVPLLEIVRSAISEAEDYVRVSVGQMPRVDITGALVADLVHLLAELVDNSTSFSPPASRVEVRGNLVGRGLVLEIEDQGLGIEPARLEELNRLLHEPPDFQVMALVDEPRLGLFVVARLAARHGIRVTLTPSPAYGGTRVVVLLPAVLLAGASGDLRGPGQPLAELAPAAPQRPLAPVAPFRLLPRDVLPGDAGTPSTPVPSPLAPVPSPLAPVPARDDDRAPSWTFEAPPPEPPPAHPVRTGDRVIVLPPDPPMPAPVPVGAGHAGRPALPRRSPQSHLSPQLKDMPVPVPDAWPLAELPDAEQARSRMAALQRGTQRGRSTDPEGRR